MSNEAKKNQLPGTARQTAAKPQPAKPKTVTVTPAPIPATVPELTQFGMEVAAMPTLTLVPAQPALEKTTVEKLLQKMKDL